VLITVDDQPSACAALLSVGGALAPVLQVLRQHRPAHVWFLLSRKPGKR
jgi:hypothetical protein